MDARSKISPSPTGCTLKHSQGLLGYFSARSRLNDGVLSAMAIMMWPCGWDGQKQATNFGQTSGQKADKTHPEWKDAGYEICLARFHPSSPPVKLQRGWRLYWCLKVVTCAVAVSGTEYGKLSAQYCSVKAGVSLQTKNWGGGLILAMWWHNPDTNWRFTLGFFLPYG